MGTSLPGCLAVCASVGRRSSSAPVMMGAMKMAGIAVGLLVVAGVLLWVLRRDGGHKEKPVVSPVGVAVGSAPPDDPGGATAPAGADKAHAKAAHQLLIEQITRARERRLAE